MTNDRTEDHNHHHDDREQEPDHKGVTNICEGEVAEVIQAGDLGDRDRDERGGSVTNIVRGRVGGSVIQAGNIRGDIRL